MVGGETPPPLPLNAQQVAARTQAQTANDPVRLRLPSPTGPGLGGARLDDDQGMGREDQGVGPRKRTNSPRLFLCMNKLFPQIQKTNISSVDWFVAGTLWVMHTKVTKLRK